MAGNQAIFWQSHDLNPFQFKSARSNEISFKNNNPEHDHDHAT